MKKRILKSISLTLALALVMSLIPFASCFAEEETRYVTVSNEADLRSLSSLCRLDTWSENTVVTLTNDIVLSGEFTPIPIFSGSFDGQGHTVSGLRVTGNVGKAGFFGILTDRASVKNLYVTGSVAPSGQTVSCGGIAGENAGYMEACCFRGTVSSDTVSGGIAGINTGTINGCANFAEVDVSVQKYTKVTLKMLKNAGIKGIAEYLVNGSVGSYSDRSGGIAGENSGNIISCKNYGLVGSRSRCDNAGGIAGVSSGYITLCWNYASVEARKNAGGITGNALPYFKSEYSEDLLKGSREQIDVILGMVDSLSLDIENAGKNVSASISGIMNDIGTASDHAKALSREVSGFVNEKISEVNDVKDYAETAVTGLNGVSSGIDEIGTAFNNGLTSISNGISILKNDLDDEDKISRAMGEFVNGITSIQDAVTGLDNTTTELHTMFENLDSEGLPEFAEISPSFTNTLTSLSGDMKTVSRSVDSLNKSLLSTINTLMENVRKVTAEAGVLFDGIYSAAYSLSDVSVSTFLKNESGEDVLSQGSLNGVISSCVNMGPVSSDECCGGIAGSMTLNGTPEIGESGEKEGVAVKSVTYRSIISCCKSYGDIESEGNFAGGICGKETVGAITQCQGYSNVKSLSGSYAGGIAGQAHGLVRNCFVRSSLSGKSYVGGIIGGGSSKQFIVDESSVVGCFSEVTVNGAQQHKGGISGDDTGNFLYNYFVVGDLNGIDEYSREFEAAPITREALLNVDGCPAEFTWSDAQLRSVTASSGTGRADIVPSWKIIAALAAIVLLIALIIFAIFKFISAGKKSKEKASGDAADTAPSKEKKSTEKAAPAHQAEVKEDDFKIPAETAAASENEAQTAASDGSSQRRRLPAWKEEKIPAKGAKQSWKDR